MSLQGADATWQWCWDLSSVVFLVFVPHRKMLKMCGDAEEQLAQELILFELEIERDVVEPLYVLAEVKLTPTN